MTKRNDETKRIEPQSPSPLALTFLDVFLDLLLYNAKFHTWIPAGSTNIWMRWPDWTKPLSDISTFHWLADSLGFLTCQLRTNVWHLPGVQLSSSRQRACCSIGYFYKRPMGLDCLFDNTDRSSKHMVMYDKQMYQNNIPKHIKCYKVNVTPFMFY